jgi:hypothetical protein
MRHSLIFFSIVFAFFACKNKTTETATTAGAATSAPRDTAQTPAGFDDFYQNFHADSLYQMAHIAWPLQGDVLDTTARRPATIYWKPENWRMHRADFDRAHYTVERSTIGDFMVIERVILKSVRYGIERRFAKQAGGDWAMIYYSDMQER